MNQALAKIKDDGRLTELYQQYFQADPPASVLEGTTSSGRLTHERASSTREGRLGRPSLVFARVD